MEDEIDGETPEEIEEEFDSLDRLLRLAAAEGDLTFAIPDSDLISIGSRAVEEYEEDKSARLEWESVVKDAQESAAQEAKRDIKDWPWHKASDVKYPMLTVASLQFQARAYPAIVKGDEACGVKVVGQDKGRPMMGPDGQPVLQQGPDGQPMPVWEKMPGAKTKRAQRVKEYLNTVLFYRVDDWEEDTDALLLQLPIVGCAFRKCYWDSYEGKQCVNLVHALRLVVPMSATSMKSAPRITEEMHDVHPVEILEKMRSGHYRYVDLAESLDEDNGDKEDWTAKPRLLLEQQRLIDLDEDGFPEPYVVTVDHETQQVLRLEANYGPDNVKVMLAGQLMTLTEAVQAMAMQGDMPFEVVKIERNNFYVKYDFFPHPQGKFYGIGLGHLLKEIGNVIDTAINQLVDAGTAQAAGGGFIGSGVSLQGAGGRSAALRFAPGEYKTVDVPGSTLRDALVERTLPQVSPVTFQVLDMMLSAAKDISSVKDVITGEAKNTGQVGTTLALIEQGLQVFTAIYKRVYRALKEEFSMLYENIAKYGGEQAARDYLELLDDPEANFENDFNTQDLDIRPISDPSSVTKMQKMARAQFLMGTMEALAQVGGDPREVLTRVYEAAEIEDIDKLLPPPQPQQPSPVEEAEAKAKEARAFRDVAEAGKTQAETAKTSIEAVEKKLDAEAKALELGRQAA